MVSLISSCWIQAEISTLRILILLITSFITITSVNYLNVVLKDVFYSLNCVSLARVFIYNDNSFCYSRIYKILLYINIIKIKRYYGFMNSYRDRYHVKYHI